MLSFLARLRQDPWAEAARLERKPQAAVTRHLTYLIRQMPLRPPALDDAEQVAMRLENQKTFMLRHVMIGNYL
jgi:hypothetical protein